MGPIVPSLTAELWSPSPLRVGSEGLHGAKLWPCCTGGNLLYDRVQLHFSLQLPSLIFYQSKLAAFLAAASAVPGQILLVYD